MTQLPSDGDPVERASWTVAVANADDDGCEVVVSRSPDRETVAVLVGPELRTVDLRDGALSEPVAVAAVDRSGLAADPVGYFRSDDGVIVWDGCTAPSVIRPGAAAALDLPLEPGWRLSLVGSMVVDGGHSGHESRAQHLFAYDEETARDLPRQRALLRERHAEALGVELPFRCATVRDGCEAVVHEESRRSGDGITTLYWPPVVGPAGVLFRRSRLTRSVGDGEGGHLTEDTEIGFPWLVARDGEVRTIPVELGVSPLCALPDGRYLLPGVDALWLDGTDEEMHVLDADGRLEPLLVEGEPLTPSRIMRKLAPQLLPTPEQRQRETVCDTKHARVDPATGDLIVLLAELPWGTDARYDPTGAWAVVAVPLDPARSWRLIATGPGSPGTHVAIAL